MDEKNKKISIEKNNDEKQRKHEERKRDLEETWSQEFKLKDYNEVANEVLENVKGQDDIVYDVLTTIYKSYEQDNKKAPKVITLIGGTGTGKTYIVKQIAEKLGMPYTLENAPDYTKNGYEGDDIQDMFYYAYESISDTTISKKIMIIFLDEIDKLVNFADDDVGGKAVYNALLAPLSGKKLRVKPPKTLQKRTNRIIDIDTINCVFIFAGVFNGLDEIRKKRLRGKSSIGFANNTDEIVKDDNPKFTKDDLISFGLPEEFVGRMNNIYELNPITEEMIKDVINSKSSSFMSNVDNLKQKHNVTLEYYEGFIDDFVKKVMKMQTGIREVESVSEELFRKIYRKIYFEKIKNKTCVLQKGIFDDNSKFEFKKIDNI